MTSEQALLQKVMVFLNLAADKRGFNFNKIIVFGVFLSQRPLAVMPNAKSKNEI